MGEWKAKGKSWVLWDKGYTFGRVDDLTPYGQPGKWEAYHLDWRGSLTLKTFNSLDQAKMHVERVTAQYRELTAARASARKAPARLHRALDARLAKDTFEVIRANGSVAGEWNTQAEADWHAKTMTKNGLGSFVVRGSSAFNNHRCNECGAEANGYASVLGRKEYLCSRHGRKFPTWKATDSARKAPARLHRALDAVLDSARVRDSASTEQVLKSVGFRRVGGSGDSDDWEKGVVGVTTSKSTDEWWFFPGGWDEGGRGGKGATALQTRVGGSRGKDRIPADCLDLGTLAL